jgi:anti-sigma factor RsiW
MSKTVVNDLDLQALVDGELSGDEEERVSAAVQSNPVLKDRFEQLRMQRRLIAAAWMQDEKSSLH